MHLGDQSLMLRGFISVLTLAALALLFAAAPRAFADGPADEEAKEAPVWSADMLVVEYTSVSIGASSADLFSNEGGSAGLQVKSLWSFTPDRDLRLEFQEAVPGAADLTLQVGDLALAFPAGSSGQSSFRWTDVNVDWEDGQTISVRIVPTSAVAARPNSPATGQPTISGTAQVGETLTADTSGIADTDGLTNATFTYQWSADDANMQDATNSTYTLADSDEGKAIQVQVFFTDDEDGLDDATFTYQWLADDANIDGATDSRYILANSDEGKAIKVRVSFTDDADNQETLTSAATAAVAAKPNSLATGAPTISGVAQVGETLTADTSDIADSDGLDNASFSYQWVRNDGTDDADMQGATASTYTPSDEDVGKTIKVKVSFTDDADNEESLTSGATAVVAAKANNPPTGQPTISGTAQVGETLTADTSSIADADGLTNVSYSYRFQWARSSYGRGFSDIGGATDSTYRLGTADLGSTMNVRVSFNDDKGNRESLTSHGTVKVAITACPVGEHKPAATAVEVEAVPIFVESTAEEYFVLYARADLDSGREFPVSVTLGRDGTTTLTEQLSALPREHYRVEKYLIADPADIDDDCIDDITELGDPVGMNPLNPARAVPPIDGAVAIPDRETFEALSYKDTSLTSLSNITDAEFVKFYIIEPSSSRPTVYFTNTNTHRMHRYFWWAIGGHGSPDDAALLRGEIVFHPNAVAPDGSLGVYRFYYKSWDGYRFDQISMMNEVLAASIPLLKNNLAYHPRTVSMEQAYRQEQALFNASRVNILLAEDIPPDVPFVAFNPGGNYGFLRLMLPDESPTPQDVVIYETLPNELPPVAGIITTVPQTPLSHVNLRAVQDGVPNAFIRDALDDGDIDDLIGRYVHYSVTEEGYSIRAASPAEVEAHYAASRPTAEQVPERDLTITQITALDEIEFDDWTAFGVKAANVAVLRTLGFPDGTVPDGFAVPFYFYDEFMKHNGFYDDIEAMLADPEFQSDPETQESELKKLRKKIKKGETPRWIIDALTEMHATYPGGQSLRYRSSTNNEDLPGFSGAGLYDSKTQHPDETVEDGISKSLKQVYASLWNFRAFTERESHGVDHLATAMGVLVHPNYSDELANGVAVSFDPNHHTYGSYYVNTQLGEDLVTNPEAHSVPEEILLHRDGTHSVLATSNQVTTGQLLMSDAQMDQLRSSLRVIHEKFEDLYAVESSEPFAIEIEFKITSDNILAIKQARPWVFGENASRPNTPATGAPTISGTAQSGATLTANTSGIADEDGLDNATFTYQWLADDANIDGATDSRYTLTSSDEGKAIKVKVSFTDDAGNEETLTSAATAAVAPQSDNTVTDKEAPVWSADMLVVEYTSVSIGASSADLFSNEGGSAGLQVKSLWSFTPDRDLRLEFQEAVPGAADLTLQVGDLALAFPAGSSGQSSFRWTDVNVDWEDGQTISVRIVPTSAVAARPNSPATGQPTISGTAQVGETLTADTSGIADTDGLTNATFTYQWSADDANMQDATNSTYTLADSDEGKAIQVKVTFTDDADNEESLTSEATNAVAATVPDAPEHVRVFADDAQGLDVAWEAPTNDGGSPITGYKVQWKEAADSWDTAEDVSEATVSGTTHTISELTGGAEYTVRVIATNAVGDGLPSGEQTGTPGETAPPELVGGGLRVDGATLRLSYNEALDETSIPSTDAFVVKVVGSGDSFTWRSERARREVESVLVTSSAVELTLATAVAPGNQVVLSYTPPTDEAAPRIRDAAENAAPGFGGTQAINDTEEASPPQLDTATVNGATLTLTYDEALDGDSVPATTTFEVTVGSDGRGVDEVSVAGSMVTLTLASAVVAEDTVTVSYTPPSEDSAARIQDQAGTVAPSFSGQAVVNDTPEAPDQGGPDANTPATGQPTISGTAQMGETLTADTSGIDDEDGLENAAFSYQWLADDTDISGATDSTYTLTDDDVGKAIKVRVSFADDASNEETLTSAATEPVTVVIWSATLTAGSGGTYSGYDLSQGAGSLSDDEFSLGAIEYSVVLVTEDDEGMLSLVLDRPLLAPFTFHVGAVRFSSEDATPEEGDDAYIYRWDKGTVDWSDGEQVELSLTLSDVPLFGVFAGVPETHDGQTVFTFELLFSRDPRSDFSYRTLKDHAFTVTGGTVTRTPRLDPPGNLSWKIHVKPNSDGDVTVVLPVTEDCSAQGAICTGSGRPLSNHLEVTVPGPQSADQNAEATGAPTISGTVQAGQTLTANTSGTADDDGLTNVSYSYQWLADDAEIQGATDSTYTLTDDEVGKAIKVRVTFTDDASNEETLTSAATAAVSARPNNPATGQPTISGTAQAGETLTANTSMISDADGLDNAEYSYQWLADDAEISGATGSTYTLTDDDVGKTIKVKVSFEDDRNNDETITSDATAAVTARPNTPATGLPTISGTAQAGQTLTAQSSGITDDDGLTNVDFSYQWLADDAEIQGATDSTYALTDDEVGKTIKVRVTFTDDRNDEETLTSTATAAVTARPNSPATGEPTISGMAQAAETLTANISAIVDADGLANVDFSYQWLADDADIQDASDSTYTLTDDDVGKAIKVRVTFTDDRNNDETLTSAATDAVAAKPDSSDTTAPPGDPSTTVEVTVGDTVAGEIEELHEVDWFRVHLLASETYQIDMRGAWGGEWALVDGEIVWISAGTLEDPKLLGVYSGADVLVSGTDEEVSGDDRGDYAEGKNSRIESFSPPADGYYYIAAAAEQGVWTGTYEIAVTVVTEE